MAKVLKSEARWIGPGPQRKDGPEHQIFRRNMWTQVTSAAAIYFRQFPKVWEVREVIVVPKKRGRPRKKKVTPKPVVVSQPEKVVESASGLGGSAIEEEPPDSGFVAVPESREEGSVV